MKFSYRENYDPSSFLSGTMTSISPQQPATFFYASIAITSFDNDFHNGVVPASMIAVCVGFRY